jgi:rhodanese-related sulfurtransferase
LYQKGLIFASFVSVTPSEAMYIIEKEENNVTILDVRTSDEFYNIGYIKNALLIPLHILESEIDKLTPFKEKKVLIYCASGNRSSSASRILHEKGFQVYNLRGGLDRWQSDGYKLIKE